MTLAELTRQFEIPKVARFEAGAGGLPCMVVTTHLASARVYLHGAHVTHFQPARQQPVLWVSQLSCFEAGKAIRGGVPVCFPWFGPRSGDPKAPGHGFARLREWELHSLKQRDDGAVDIVLAMRSDESTRAWWPIDFVLRYFITIGSSLEMTLDCRNESEAPAHFEMALHTYLSVGDIRRTTVEGLAGASYIDKVDVGRLKRQDEALVRFVGETDRVYLDTLSTCVVHDPVMDRRIAIEKRGSPATVVWNPWVAKSKTMADFGDEEWPGMVCVETANAGPCALVVPAGAEHSMTAVVKVI